MYQGVGMNPGTTTSGGARMIGANEWIDCQFRLERETWDPNMDCNFE